MEKKMTNISMNHTIAMSIGRDAGNASMRRNQRSAWAEDDWNAAAEAVSRIFQAVGWDEGSSVGHTPDQR